MREQIQDLWHGLDKWLIVYSLVLGIVLPAMRHYTSIFSKPMFSLWILIIINCAFAIYEGIHVANRHAPWWEMIIFPVIFLIGMHFYLPKYTVFFFFGYLCLSYLGYGMSKGTNE